MSPEGAGSCWGCSAGSPCTHQSSSWAPQPSAESPAGINCLAFGLFLHPRAHEITPHDTRTAILSPEQASRVCCVCDKVLAGVLSRKKFLFFLGIKQQLLLFPTWQLRSKRMEVSAQEGTFESGGFSWTSLHCWEHSAALGEPEPPIPSVSCHQSCLQGREYFDL